MRRVALAPAKNESNPIDETMLDNGRDACKENVVRERENGRRSERLSAPVVDGNGLLVGIVSNGAVDPDTGKKIFSPCLVAGLAAFLDEIPSKQSTGSGENGRWLERRSTRLDCKLALQSLISRRLILCRRNSSSKSTISYIWTKTSGQSS
jgi:hypothetical protein